MRRRAPGSMMMSLFVYKLCVSTSEAFAKHNQTTSPECWSVDHRHSNGILHFAKAADTVAAVQRGLKLKSAWMRVMGILIREKKGVAHTGWLPKVALASEEFLGVWINGAKEEEALWLLAHKIPCFIIHKVPVLELYIFTEDHTYPDFMAKMDVLLLHWESNGFDHLAIKMFTLINDQSDQGRILRLNPVLHAQDRGLSNPIMQGWLGSQHIALDKIPEVSMKLVSNLPPDIVVPSPVT